MSNAGPLRSSTSASDGFLPCPSFKVLFRSPSLPHHPMNHSCFAPPTRLLIGRREFEVRELAWPEALEFFRRLGAATTAMLTSDGKPRPTADFLPELITQAGAAVSFLLQHSVGLSADELQSLPGTAVVRLTQSALELTLNEMWSRREKPWPNACVGRSARQPPRGCPPPPDSARSSIPRSQDLYPARTTDLHRRCHR